MHGITLGFAGWAGSITAMTGAAAAAIAGVWIAGRRDRFGLAGTAIVASLALTALWSLAIAVAPNAEQRQGLLEAMANLGWLLVVYRLFAGDGRHTSLAPIRPLALALAFVEFLHIGVE